MYFDFNLKILKVVSTGIRKIIFVYINFDGISDNKCLKLNKHTHTHTHTHTYARTYILTYKNR